MISLVQRVGDEDSGAWSRRPAGLMRAPRFTFLQDGGPDGPVRKAAIEACKLTLGQLRHGGVWLTPIQKINEQLTVAEGIETALSVMQLQVPTVAALSAAGMRSLRWPHQVRRLWIAADNDEAGLKAAKVLLGRALRAGVQAHIKVPVRGENDFNDLLEEARWTHGTARRRRAAAAAAGVPSICPAIDDGTEDGAVEELPAKQDAFAGTAEEVAADETRRKIELFAWADSVLRLSEAELEGVGARRSCETF